MAARPRYRFSSKFYDVFDLIFLLGRKGNPRSGLLDVIPNTPQDILDICVGTASSSIQVAAHHNQTRILGIDISDEMLSVAQKKIARNKLTNLKVQKMSAEALQFADDSFDSVMISFALHELEPDLQEKIFQEVSRVLKPGGRFCVIDFSRQENFSNRIFIMIWKTFEPPCFTDFLSIVWHQQLAPYGFQFESEKEFSFSSLYVMRKAKQTASQGQIIDNPDIPN